MLLATLILLLIASRVLAKSVTNHTETKTKTNPEPNKITENIYKEITNTPEALGEFPKGNMSPSTQEVEKTPQRGSIESTDALSELLMRESSNNPLAVNPSSGACGLGQALPCSKMLNWIGVETLEEATYDQQLSWMKYYIENRYVTAEIALEHHNEFGWY